MISFELNEEQVIAQASVREFAAEVLTPAAQHADDQSALPSSVLAKLWELGIVQARAEEGVSDTAIMNALLLEELACGDASAAVAVAAPLGFVTAIAEQGSPAQKAHYLPLLSGDDFHGAAVLLMEPSVSFSSAKLATKARKVAEGYCINGVKSFVPLADQCQHFLVLAELDGRPQAFIIDAETARVERRNVPATLGLRGLRAGEIAFNDVIVPEQNILGEGAGCDAERLMDASRAALSAILTGVSACILNYVIPYTKDRIAHGEALAKKQTIAFRIADMHMKTEAMRWMHWRAARSVDHGSSTARLCRLAQIYANTHAMWVADEGLQMLGGHGFTREYPLEMWYRNVRTLSLLDGMVGV
ncbi:acyl-CoA dehydrogenase family protein [Noviherbaspirillum pedocola]|uniref:Acyl-CoA dehydrogenase n=1 Tax=Noviherbaspirillum pedocola TaxID=2801341 RepID=A0A934T328_9BURK|nr:acyl-CoA dehydrogenase [Noviherbaspirillum pedocola]MBK4738509.1 acyl-CoA dehydrogenase [Noviherbaspirillum pedocola]